MRLEVSRGTPQQLERAVVQFGSTNVSIASRLIEWLIVQDGPTQALVLGLYPEDVEKPDATRLVLERMAKD